MAVSEDIKKLVTIIKDAIEIADQIYEFIEKVRGMDQEAYVKGLANTVYYASKEKYNVMVLNLAMRQGPSGVMPSGVEHYSTVKAPKYHTEYGVWVFSGEGQWVNEGSIYGYKMWTGIGNIKRFADTDLKIEKVDGKVMKFYPRN